MSSSLDTSAPLFPFSLWTSIKWREKEKKELFCVSYAYWSRAGFEKKNCNCNCCISYTIRFDTQSYSLFPLFLSRRRSYCFALRCASSFAWMIKNELAALLQENFFLLLLFHFFFFLPFCRWKTFYPFADSSLLHGQNNTHESLNTSSSALKEKRVNIIRLYVLA